MTIQQHCAATSAARIARSLRAGAIAGLLLAAAPAAACMGPFAERVIFTLTPPDSVPDGLTVVKVRLPILRQLLDRRLVEVDVTDRRMRVPQPKTMLVSPGPWSSCTRWGRRSGDAWVMGVWSVGADGQALFAAVQRRRRRSDADVGP